MQNASSIYGPILPNVFLCVRHIHGAFVYKTNFDYGICQSVVNRHFTKGDSNLFIALGGVKRLRVYYYSSY